MNNVNTLYVAVRMEDGDSLVTLKTTRENVISIIEDHRNNKYRDFSFKSGGKQYNTTTEFVHVVQ